MHKQPVTFTTCVARYFVDTCLPRIFIADTLAKKDSTHCSAGASYDGGVLCVCLSIWLKRGEKPRVKHEGEESDK